METSKNHMARHMGGGGANGPAAVLWDTRQGGATRGNARYPMTPGPSGCGARDPNRALLQPEQQPAEVERAKHRALSGSGESGAATGKRCDRREHGVPQALRRKGRVRVRMWGIPSDAHSLAGDGHSPRQRPVLGLRCHPPGPRGGGTRN
jgi:hypothetical protein